jgi:hypothetical protein
VVVDEYDETLNGIQALGEVDWELAPTWESLDPTELFNGAGKRWYEYVDVGEQGYTLIAIGGDDGNEDYGEDPDATIPRLLLHGRVFTRSSRDDCDPDSYESFAETPDFDFGDSEAWKYVDTVYLHVDVPVVLQSPIRLKVEIGSRNNLSSPLTWSDPAWVEVSGGQGGPVTAKANCRGAGRLIRVRFSSEETEAQWRISGYRVIARIGNTY